MSAGSMGRLEVRLEMVGAGIWLMMKFEPAAGVMIAPWAHMETHESWGSAMERVELQVKDLPGVDLDLDDRT